MWAILDEWPHDHLSEKVFRLLSAVLGYASLAATILSAVFCIPCLALAQQQDKDPQAQDNDPQKQDKDPFLLYDKDGLKVRVHFQAGVNAVKEQNLFFDLADIFAPNANFNADTGWIEGYVKPGVSIFKEFRNKVTTYGKFSFITSGTGGIDAFDTGNVGRTTVEEAFAGVHLFKGKEMSFDLSFGAREFKAGTGMLISNGGSSGFDRGALKLGPRKAWRVAGLGIVQFGRLSGAAFYLGPNELRQSHSDTKLVGGDVRYDWRPGIFAGVTFGHVPESLAPYPKAPPGGIGPPSILPGAREGLRFVNFYGRAEPLPKSLPTLFVGGDLAIERNGRIDLEAWAGRIQVGYSFSKPYKRDWSPIIAYTYQTFSGDDPFTSKLERFDPLYYEGNPSAWATGSKSSMLFLNSNVNSHQVSVQFTPTDKSTLTVRYAWIGANELRSPIQFGQGTRLDISDGSPNVVVGATKSHLANDLYLEYMLMVNRNIFLTAGISGSKPGPGIKSIAGMDRPNWNGGYANVIFNY